MIKIKLYVCFYKYYEDGGTIQANIKVVDTLQSAEEWVQSPGCPYWQDRDYEMFVLNEE
jgi:hypothetical protein